MRKNIEELINSGITAHQVAVDTGIARNGLYRLFRGETDIDNLKFITAETLSNYWEENKMNNTKWSFENYTVEFEESENMLRFEDKEGNLLGYVSNVMENDLIEDLNNGANPIAEGWEDGIGNTITIDGWE